MSMAHGSNGGKGSEDAPPPRPPSQQSSGSSSGGSKHLKCIGRYVLTGHTLGKGNFARVEAAVHTLTRAKVAVKIIETDKIKEDYVRKNLLREAQLMRRLHHPNIIRLYETMKTNNLYCLVTEIADGGELLSYVRNDCKDRRLTEPTARPFIRQLVSALNHLHSTGIVHRDLKMENILLDQKKRNIKIVDFGLSNSTKPGSLLQTHCGSPEYAAPELFIPGREYGPEVDVWSLGVNMYAMLVGKLPFRSPRQGAKRRQKLLEQISNGISEYHEKEMAHISIGARDLIGRLLQPDPRRRANLRDIMQHPWLTKNGEHALLPYQEQPIDSATKSSVIDIMSAVLEVTSAEIRDAVKRDRCDWLAAVFNLLIEQPEGRNIIQQLLNEDPEDQLVDAMHYQGSIEHFRLSQADALDVSSGTNGARVSTKSQGHAHRHSLSQPHPESNDYVSSTLPLPKREKKHHHSQDSRPLGHVPRVLNPLQHPPAHMGRRASIASPYNSPEHQTQYLPGRDPILSHYYHQQREKKSSRGRRLPSTPTEEPYSRHPQEPVRPHSRADSMPGPLPMPWRHNIAPITQLAKSTAAQQPPPIPETTPQPKPSLNHHGDGKQIAQNDSMAHNEVKPPVKKNSLKPIRPKSHALGSKSLSRSVDTNLHVRVGDVSHQHTRSVMWPLQAQVGTMQKMSTNGAGRMGVSLGWGSANNIHNKKALPGKLGKDIQGLMEERSAPPTAYSSIRDIPQEVNHPEETGSIVSVDIQPEIFKPRHHEFHTDKSQHQQHSRMISGENLKVDPISGGEVSHLHGHPRQLYPESTSAKQSPPNHPRQRPMTSGYVNPSPLDKMHALQYRSNGDMYQHQHEHEQELIKTRTRKTSASGILGRAFKFKNSREKSVSASTTLHTKAL